MSRSTTTSQSKQPDKRLPTLEAIKRNAALWLRQGTSPRRLALTLALGLAIGCIPVVGVPTVLCAALALALKLNLPAIQAANYAVMPLQLMLIVPFVRLGGWLGGSGNKQALAAGALLHASPLRLAAGIGSLAGQALLAWVVIATPAVLLLTFTLTRLLRRIPAVAMAEAGD
ncbi:MAG: DUF2062 domain-containing protein [Terracidiphilus sp.]|nr:DUF2062 domain-containing protein [Terracidiphilus sp.]